MYTEWTSLSPAINENCEGAQKQSVLNKFSGVAGREVAIAVVKQLAGNLGITQPAEPSQLESDQEVQWCMNVICFGLSLPLTEHETIKDCVNVYCEWMTALHPVPKISVPKPICEDPNTYARKIISHFHNLFVPRSGEGVDTINRQAVLCHRVLRTLQHTAQLSQILTRETWEALLLFLLAINEILLAPPTIKDDVGDQLCERVLSVLFEVWLLACVRCFPSPSLWKTLQESCGMWRHRIALIEQWNRVNLGLTARLLEFTYGSAFPELKILEEDASLIPQGMTNDCIAQTWYRFIRVIGSPIGLCSPTKISHTPNFMQYCLLNNNGIEPHQHPCLLILPQIFLKAIKGISSQVDAFLGIYQSTQWDDGANPMMEPTSSLSTSSTSQNAQISSTSSTTQYHLHRGGGASSGSGGSSGIGSGSSGVVAGASMSSSSTGGDKHFNASTRSGGGGGCSSSGSGVGGGITGVGHCLSGIGVGLDSGGVSCGGAGVSGGGNVPCNLITPIISGSSNSSIAGYSGITALTGTFDAPHSPTPPLQRRLAKSFSVAPSGSQHKGLSKTSLIGLTSSRASNLQSITTPNSGPSSSTSFTSIISIGQENRPPLAQTRPKCNSILHLFGDWLFEAALIGSDSWFENTKKQQTEASRRPSSMIMDSRKGSLSISQPSSLNEPTELPSGLTIDKYESGRAEAIGALCRIICAKKTGEEILPVYLARFYVAIQQGLKITETRDCEETLASILFNSSDLFRLDLDGIQVLLPSFIAALELVLPEKDLKIRFQSIIFNKTELRRASIHILLSIISLPLHFQTLPIRDITGCMNDKVTFIQLKPRLINILMMALQVESDAQNTHMLLGGLLLTVQDAAMFEETENIDMIQTSPQPSDTNLLSSACSEKSACSIASGNSSIGGNSTATLGVGGISSGISQAADMPSLTLSDDFPGDLLHEIEMISLNDNAHALFVRATYLVCHRLISSWKTDLNVSLAALELLTGLARMLIKDSEALECKRAVKWICDYICYQCSRPPQAHSKDLHSTIVAAFQCTSAWLMQHPYLLQDKDCLTTVLEVVELGISGSKSIGKPGEPIKLKDEKELKPASMRVRDAAENLLTVILEQVGYFPSECGPQSLSSLLDEVALIRHCNSSPGNVTQEQAVQKFKYFVTENSTVLALLDEPLGNDQDPQPTVTLLIRGPFGRNAWTMQLRHLPRSKSGTKYHAPNPGRPVPMNDMPLRQDVDQKNFPEGVERVTPCIADYSIPTIENIIQLIGSDSTKQLFHLLESQTVYEKLAWAETESSVDSLSHAQEAIPPPVCHEFQAARLFLSHFGFLSLDENGEKPAHLLTCLDTKREGFSNELYMLDKMSPRTCDTVHVFYVKIGQNSEADIIGNMNNDNLGTLDPHFWNMANSLGWPVNINEHSGWTGFLNSSWKINNVDPVARPADEFDNMKLNGEKKVLYWADVGAEIAFVIPTAWNKFDENDGGCISTESIPSYERSVSEIPPNGKSVITPITHKKLLGDKPRTLSLDFDKKDPIAPSRRRTGAIKTHPLSQSTTKIMLVWLESFEDHLTFPVDDMLAYTKTGDESISGQFPRCNDVHIIFIQSLTSGLLRVKLQGPLGRMNFATPLVDGMVISQRVAGNLVRQTAHNMARRRRLENDIYQPPHVRRRLKVQDLVQKYKIEMTEPELLANLFTNSY